MDVKKTPLDGLIQELRRGSLVLAVLSQLKESLYGYSLVKNLTEKGMEIDKNTLYPLLRRLEKQELLISEWDVKGSRPRRYYKLSEEGQVVFKKLTEEWTGMNNKIERLLEGADQIEGGE